MPNYIHKILLKSFDKREPHQASVLDRLALRNFFLEANDQEMNYYTKLVDKLYFA